MRSATGSAVLYFAYGSNMSTPRLRYRVASCRFAFVARLPNYRLCFHKRSTDGSAKCNAFKTAMPADAVIGAVYEIPRDEKPALDCAEGTGARIPRRDSPRAITPRQGNHGLYIHRRRDFHSNGLKPYIWYKDFVVAGAEEHKLPPAYVESYIRAVDAIRDPDAQRERARRAEVKF